MGMDVRSTEGFVETPATRLHYVDWGGDGPPLVLVHATGFHARLWDPYAAQLCRRFRVLAYDQRGHGDSALPATGIDWPDFAEDLAAFIAALNIEGCFAVGHSSGGTAVGVCAGRYPGSIARAALIDPVLRDGAREARPSAAPKQMAARTRRRRHVWSSPYEFETAMRQRAAFAAWRPEFLALYARYGLRRRPDGHYELKCPPEVEAQVYARSSAYDPWPALRRVDVPVLLVRATRVPPGRAPLPPDAATRIPNCQDVPIAATHFVPMEEPEHVLAALEAFSGTA